MRVAGIGVAIPSRRMSNDDVIELLVEDLEDDLRARTIARSARSLLEATGAAVRFYRTPDERPAQLVEKAMLEALAVAELRPEEIDLLIYCSVGRAFIEPGNAYICAAQLGVRCDCFDISDACMAFLRATQVAYDGMQAGRYRNVLLVNAEFGVYELFDNAFRVETAPALRDTFVVYTLGEAAVATVLRHDSTPWSFAYRTRPDLAELCFYGLPGYKGFVPEGSLAARGKPMTFSSRSAELFAAADEELGALLSHELSDFSRPRLYVPHAASSTAATATARRLGIAGEHLYASVMPRYGNVASASLPLGLRCALDEGRLQAGDEVVLCPASAGLSVAVARFIWGSGDG